MAREAHHDPTDLRGRLIFWRRTAVILIGVGLLVAAGILVSVLRTYLTPARSDIAVPWVGECRVAEDGDSLYVTVDLTAISDGLLRETSTTRASQGAVEAAVILEDRLDLGGRSDDELDDLMEGARADGRGRFGVDGFDTGTLLAVIELPDGVETGKVDGLRTLWDVGEMRAEQSIPLGLVYASDGCLARVPQDSG